MKRIVFWYASVGNAGLDQEVHWNPKKLSVNGLAEQLNTEGIWWIFKKLLDEKLVDEVFCVVESYRSPGIIKWAPNFYCRVLPHIDLLEPYLQPSDIIFARGGFRSWFHILGRMNAQKKWVLFYRAASNRGKWPFWDIVLDDLVDKPVRDPIHNRLHLDFHKPVNPRVFYLMDGTERKFDLLINASHIHDKKGQWKAIDAAIAYRKLFKRDLKICLPGSEYGGVKTLEMYQKIQDHKIQDHKLDVFMPGMVPRKTVCELMNQSKLYIHLGGAGQNDRGALEAMACGCPVILGNPQFHPPWLVNAPSTVVTEHQYNSESLAQEIEYQLQKCRPYIHSHVSEFYEKNNGMEEVVMPQWRGLLSFLKKYPIPDREAALKEYGC